MANVVSILAPTKAIKIGRGLRVDNVDLEIGVINHDSSTTATITANKLRRIRAVQFFDWTGAVITPTVTGLNGKVLTVTGLPANVFGITFLMKGEAE
jgi:hypothetical protein